MDSKRSYKRKRVNARIKIDAPLFRPLNGKIYDISDGGVFVVIGRNTSLSIGSQIQMKMLDSANPAVNFNMQIMRKNNQGLGLKFIDYELNGQIHQISELRSQWNMVKTEVRNIVSTA